MPERRLLRDVFDAAIAAASPDKAIPPDTPPPPAGRTVVVGAGKAAASIAPGGGGPLAGGEAALGLRHAVRHGVGPLKRIEAAGGHPPGSRRGRAEGGGADSRSGSRASAPRTSCSA